jgi:hypothetical protein
MCIMRNDLAEYDAIAAVLNDHPREPIPAFVYHTGGGIWAVRVDILPEGGKPSSEGGFINTPPHLLITPRADYDGGKGYAIGYYPTWEHTGEWPTGEPLRFADDLDGIHAIVMQGADDLTTGAAGAS